MKKNVEPDDSVFEGCKQVGSDPPAYKTTHYIVEADSKYIHKALGWAKYIESNIYPTMLEMMEHTPTVNLHVLHFVEYKYKNRIRCWFKGIKKFRSTAYAGSQIYIFQKKLDSMPPYQQGGGITWETIHGLLDEIKKRANWKPIWETELLDYIFEIELYRRLGNHKACDNLYNECLSKGRGYKVLAQFWKSYGWQPFQLLILHLHRKPNSHVTFDQGTLVRHMSLLANQDFSGFFKGQGWNVDDTTKE